jgi:DNA-directed RNA polymerase subunit K/omega
MLENRFEFVVVAGARARQLIRGAIPRVTGNQKPVTLAQREVRTGVVKKVDPKEAAQASTEAPAPDA